eukprot:NODE_221_length_1981_cov_311.202381_g176_i0.p1 GENE.NODE_221_length_1981_cov_311.202381_g176_i0~~NODE_221_length_1981_cov_311.202381_g176_i0.p1  ORF type:complete len:462 (-),score=105.97 NODE_221_length_1981_cov_311.202381_g176_i0:548-1933(-)
MDDICFPFLTTRCCPTTEEKCALAHYFQELSNVDNWLLFDAPNVVMLDFLAYKYHSHHYFKVHILPGQGPLVRFASPEDAEAVLREYRAYYNPQSVKAIIASVQDCCKQTDGSLRIVEECGGSLSSAPESDESKSETSAGEGDSKWLARRPIPADSKKLSIDVPHWPLPEMSAEDNAPLMRSNSEESVDTPLSVNVLSPANQVKGQPKKTIFTESWADTCTERVLRVLQANTEARKASSCGWKALREIWKLGSEELDAHVLSYLNNKAIEQREQILLSFAAIDLSGVKNLSAYLNCLIKEHETTNQVCFHFLAGLCGSTDEVCKYVHPVRTKGWIALNERWNVSYKDLDYAVLNYLCKKPVEQQNEILLLLADMNLRTVKNLSAYLSSLIQKHENRALRKQLAREGLNRNTPTKGGNFTPRSPPSSPFSPASPFNSPNTPGKRRNRRKQMRPVASEAPTAA